MTRYWLFRRTVARYPTVKSAVRTQIVESAEDEGIDVDDEEGLIGYRSTRLFDLKYEWEIKQGADAYILLERVYISVAWYVLFVVSVVGGFTGALLVPQPFNFLAVLGMVLLLSLIVPPFFYKSPVDATITTNEMYRTNPPGRIFLLIMIPLFLVTVLFVLFTVITQPSFWAVTLLFVGLLVYMLVLFKRQRILYRSEEQQFSGLYELIGGYLLYMILAALPASTVIAFRPKIIPTPTLSTYELVLVIGIEILILGLVYTYIRLRRTFNYHSFVGEPQYETMQRSMYRVPVLVVIAGATYSLLYILWYAVRHYSGYVSLDSPLLSAVILLAVLPLLYIPVGILLQTITFPVEIWRLFKNSDPIESGGDTEVSIDVDAQVRKLYVDGYVAGSYSTGVRNYIFVSETMVQELESDELAAVIAHEEGHIYHGDALLSFFLPLVALLMVTGKNIVYAVMDFHSREYRADQYAAEKVGEEPLRRALQKIASTTDDTDRHTAQPQFTAAPTLISAPRLNNYNIGIRDRYFGSYFGNFALTEAHPSIDERIQQINDR